MVAKPTLILADEPTGNLHSDQGQEIMELFQRLNEARHDDRPGDALEGRTPSYGKRVIKLKDGWIVDEN